MADIRQAAKWMQEGKRVRRSDLSFVTGDYIDAERVSGCLVYHFSHPDSSIRKVADCRFDAKMLLAEDWEIAE